MGNLVVAIKSEAQNLRDRVRSIRGLLQSHPEGLSPFATTRQSNWSLLLSFATPSIVSSNVAPTLSIRPTFTAWQVCSQATQRRADPAPAWLESSTKQQTFRPKSHKRVAPGPHSTAAGLAMTNAWVHTLQDIQTASGGHKLAPPDHVVHMRGDDAVGRDHAATENGHGHEEQPGWHVRRHVIIGAAPCGRSASQAAMS